MIWCPINFSAYLPFLVPFFTLVTKASLLVLRYARHSLTSVMAFALAALATHNILPSDSPEAHVLILLVLYSNATISRSILWPEI